MFLSIPHKEEMDKATMAAVLTVPDGSYSVTDTGAAQVLVDTLFAMYGSLLSNSIDKNILRGLAVAYPDQVYIAFTHGQDHVKIKRTKTSRWS